MKILLANEFYYHRGGDCIYMLNQEKQQKAHGNEVAVFAMGYLKNLNTPWKKFFPKNMSKLMAFTRLVGDVENLKDKIEKMFAMTLIIKPSQKMPSKDILPRLIIIN